MHPRIFNDLISLMGPGCGRLTKETLALLLQHVAYPLSLPPEVWGGSLVVQGLVRPLEKRARFLYALVEQRGNISGF